MNKILQIRLSIFFAFLFVWYTSTAQKGTLKGIVIDEENTPIENVLVVVDGEWQILTDENGQFSLPYGKNKEPEEVVAFLKGFKVSAWYYNPNADAVKITLTSGNVMGGIVREESGDPVSNTTIDIQGFQTDNNLTTDKYGYFKLLLPEEASLHNAYVFKVNNKLHDEHHYTFSPTHAFYTITYNPETEEKKKEHNHIQYVTILRSNLKPIAHTPVVIDDVHYLTDPNGTIILQNKVPKSSEFKLHGYNIIRTEFFGEEETLHLIVNVEKPPVVADTITPLSALDKDFDLILKNLQKEKHLMLDNNALMNNEIVKIQEKISKGDTLSKENKEKLKYLLSQIEKEAQDIHKTEEGVYQERDNDLIFNLQSLLLEKDSINKIVQARLQKVEEEKILVEQEYRAKIIRMTIIGVLLLALTIVGYALALHIRKQKQQLSIANIELEDSRARINSLYNEQLDGIKLAQVTQKTILPPKSFLQTWLPDHFILYKPKDIVSGDFYWADTKDGYLYLALVDCTGHGVAGAFTSMLGYSLLNYALQNTTDPSPAALLDKLNEGVIRSLRQGTEGSESKDGMDITMVKYHPNKNTIHVAGTGRSLYIIRNEELLQYKLDKFSIGVPKFNKEVQKFTNQVVEIQKEDMIYIFTDGYADQLGGEDGMQKFMYNQFRELLLAIYKDPLELQKTKLDSAIVNWTSKTEQIDDITVMGIKV